VLLLFSLVSTTLSARFKTKKQIIKHNKKSTPLDSIMSSIFGGAGSSTPAESSSFSTLPKGK
jgi:hypothetical protein